MSKQKRNALCHCGSGKKFKKCCGKELQKMETEKLSNKFRDQAEKAKENNPQVALDKEAAKVGDVVLLTRDQFVSMRQLQHQKEMSNADKEYTLWAIGEYEKFLAELKELPLSEGRDGTIAGVEKQMSNLNKQLQMCQFARVAECTLKALEVLFGSEERPVEVDTVGEIKAMDESDDLQAGDDEQADEPELQDDETPGDGVDEESSLGEVI